VLAEVRPEDLFLGRHALGMTREMRVMLRKWRQCMLSEKLLPPQVPQPIDSENGRPLSKLPPVAKQCAWLTITRATGSSSASRIAWRSSFVCSDTEWPLPW
jgi:hypothetical protein